MRSWAMMLTVEVIAWICLDERRLRGGRADGEACFQIGKMAFSNTTQVERNRWETRKSKRRTSTPLDRLPNVSTKLTAESFSSQEVSASSKESPRWPKTADKWVEMTWYRNGFCSVFAFCTTSTINVHHFNDQLEKLPHWRKSVGATEMAMFSLPVLRICGKTSKTSTSLTPPGGVVD